MESTLVTFRQNASVILTASIVGGLGYLDISISLITPEIQAFLRMTLANGTHALAIWATRAS
jgi:hypothetical protein